MAKKKTSKNIPLPILILICAVLEVGPAVGHDVKAVGEVGDVAVHMVGQENAFAL